MMNNKKGNIVFVAVGAGLLIVLLVAVFGGAVSSKRLVESLTPTVPGCNPKPIGVRVTGELLVVDGNNVVTWIKPEPEQIMISEVKAYNKLSVLDWGYDWEVCAVNPSNGNEVGCARGNSDYPITKTSKFFFGGLLTNYFGGWEERHKFVIDFAVPDSNCNGVLDEEFDIFLVAKAGPSDKVLMSTLSFRDGRWSVRDN